MRITGGKARGIPLNVPAKGEVRPATDYLREAVFSSLGPQVARARVLDLFAGSGAYGLEAISRGAAAVTLVEKDRRAQNCLKDNLTAVEKSLGQSFDGKVVAADVLRWQASGQADIVFADPPYSYWETRAEALLELLGYLATATQARTFVLEAPGGREPEVPENFTLRKSLGKGKTQPAAWIYDVGT
ncbi:MAG: 16S rRNA (guanine(966)-N(2))-methyltransferase RsmD [Verrucomicrobiota bacterium]